MTEAEERACEWAENVMDGWSAGYPVEARDLARTQENITALFTGLSRGMLC